MPATMPAATPPTSAPTIAPVLLPPSPDESEVVLVAEPLSCAELVLSVLPDPLPANAAS